MENTQKKPTEIKSKEEIANRNIAIYLNMASRSPTLELHAALILDLLSRGNKVTAYACDSSFLSSMENPFNASSIEAYKMFRVKDLVNRLGVPLKTINLANQSESVNERISEILELGSMSSFASLLKAQSKDELDKKWLGAYNNMVSSAKKLYNYFSDEIVKEKYDFVFMYNGRFGDVRPVLEATKDAGVGFGLNELKRITLEVVFVNELVHSIEGNTRKALDFYEKDKEAAEINAKKFFLGRLAKKDKKEPIYTKKQTMGSLPDAVVNTTKKVIAIYPTTDDEYKFIGKEWKGRVPQDQVAEIEGVVKHLPEEEYLVVVKMHPNQEHTAENTIGRYLELSKKYPHVVVEKPRSTKDSYALMMRADVVIVFASTIGFEACYARKPVILIGDTTWGEMNIAHKVYSGEEATKLIKGNIEPKPVLGAIIWGNYYDAYRDRLPALSVIDDEKYLIDGKPIGQSAIRRIMQLPAKLEINLSRPGFKFGATFVLKTIDTIFSILKNKF